MENSLYERFPQIAKELHPSKNGHLSAENLSYASNQKVWWLCSKCGQEYQMKVSNRTILGQGCKYCNIKKVTKSIICVETREIFDSISDAARAYNLKGSSSINKVLAGERKLAAGCHWEFVNSNTKAGRKKKPIFCKELNRIFATQAEAERDTGVNHHSISRCLRGEAETAGGYHWSIYEED